MNINKKIILALSLLCFREMCYASTDLNEGSNTIPVKAESETLMDRIRALPTIAQQESILREEAEKTGDTKPWRKFRHDHWIERNEDEFGGPVFRDPQLWISPEGTEIWLE